METSWHDHTLAIHAGEAPDPVTGASSPNLVMSTTFAAGADIAFSAEAASQEMPFVYTRWGNPTVRQLEQKIAALEHAPDAVALASGMAAFFALAMQLIRSGDRVVLSDVTYAAVSETANEWLVNLGLEVVRVDASDLDALRRAVTPQTKWVHIETPCNPLLRLTDIKEAAQIAHRAGAVLSVDSTFATSLATRPLELGADYVIHSLTKYICGHGDALGGVIAGSAELIEPIRRKSLIRTGGALSPFNAWLILRGAATLPLRMKQHEANALQIARYLEGHPAVKRVIYPGLASHPQYELAKRQMHNFSGMLTFEVKGDGIAQAYRFAEKLRVIHYAVSLGHHRSLLFYLPSQALLATTFHLDAAQLASWKKFAGEGIFRFSVGLEDPEDVIADLEQSFL